MAEYAPTAQERQDADGIARALAKRYAAKGLIEEEDAYQLAREAIAKNERAFDPTLGNEYTSYAFRYARGAILDNIKKNVRYAAEARAAQTVAAIVQENADFGDPFDDTTKRQAHLKNAVRALSIATLIAFSSGPPTPEDHYLEAERKAAGQAIIQTVLAKADPLDREIFVACAVGGARISDFARERGIDERNARYRLLRTMEAMAEVASRRG